MSITMESCSQNTKAVAPWWHTSLLVAFFLLLTLAGFIFQHRSGSQETILPQQRNLAPLYLYLILGQWVLLYYVWKVGLRRTGTKLRDLIGGSWPRVVNVLRDVVLAIALWTIWLLIQLAWDRVFGSGHASSISSLLPRRTIELVLWVALSISAGICEEAVFRGYLLRQFQAWTRSFLIAVLLQAVLFGVSHGYQGVAATLKITVFGCLFGLVAGWRQSLRPGMIAHALTDVLAVVL